MVHLLLTSECAKKKCVVEAYRNGKDCDQTVKPHSLIMTFVIQQYIVQYPVILEVISEETDQTLYMRRLVWAFAVSIGLEGTFLHGAVQVTAIVSNCMIVNPCPAEPRYALQLQTVWIQISWLLRKPTDLDLHCLSLSM